MVPMTRYSQSLETTNPGLRGCRYSEEKLALPFHSLPSFPPPPPPPFSYSQSAQLEKERDLDPAVAFLFNCVCIPLLPPFLPSLFLTVLTTQLQ